MIDVDIPGYGLLRLKHLVMDYNGTMAIDGKLIEGVAELLLSLHNDLEIHVVTADTFGIAREQLSGQPVKLSLLSTDNQAIQKFNYIETIGAEFTVAIGNGRNDRYMVKSAKLGIALAQNEGLAIETLTNADILMPDINSALRLLKNHKRLIATLRS